MDTYLVSRMPPGLVEAFTVQIESVGGSFLGPQYTPRVRAVVPGPRLHTVVTLARNEHNPMPELFFEDKALLYLFSGYVVDDLTQDKRLKRYFGHEIGEDRPILRSPGGIYSYATVRRSDGRVCAGHSTPTLEPVYYAASLNHLHVGNNPLLVHAAARGFQDPEINEPFFFSAVGAGVAIDDTTPFVGCYRVPPRTLLVTSAASFGIQLRPAPRPAHGRYKIATYRQRRESVAEAVTDAASILERLPRGELRLSGGKDSRLLSAALRSAGTAITPVNQNFPGEVEGQVADMVAGELGFDSCLRPPIEEVIDRHHIGEGTHRKIAYAGGLPAVATVQYPSRAEATRAGIPLVMGHAHLQRGGFLGRIRNVPDALAVATSRTVSAFLRSAYVEPNMQRTHRFVYETLRQNRNVVQSIAFFAYLDYVLNYQFQSLYAYVRNWNPLVTPMVDERFVSLCEDIVRTGASSSPDEYAGITDLHSERLVMGATLSLAPSLLQFPLADDRYRCDGPAWPGYPLRDPYLVREQPTSEEDRKRVFNTRHLNPAVRRMMWEQIRGSCVESFGAAACRPEIWHYVSNPDSPGPKGENIVLVNQFLWGLYGFSIILGTHWWTELSR